MGTYRATSFSHHPAPYSHVAVAEFFEASTTLDRIRYSRSLGSY